MQELEQERMLRLNAEQELQELAIKSNNNRSQHRALQEEYKKMEEMARTMGHYANNLEQLKREKAMLTVTYESNLQKCRAHISNLEQENKLLTAEVQKLESQLQSSSSNKDLSYRVSSKLTACSQSDSDKCKVLLERLKMLEGEKSALVLENERQRAQYEKYLDEIANQVVQALMSQKSLREECAKLQRRVIDLEYQNRQLHHMFQQRIRFASDSVLQSVPAVKSAIRGGDSEGRTASSSCGRQQAQSRAPRHPESGQILLHATASPFSEVSLESLQSMCSNNNEALQMDEALGKPELCSPPPWLRDKLLQGGSPTSSLSSPIPTEHPSLSVAPSVKQLGQYPTACCGDETAANAIARYLAGIKPAPFPDSMLPEEGQGQLLDSQFMHHMEVPSRGNPPSFRQQLTRQDDSRNPILELPLARGSGAIKDDQSNRLLHGHIMLNRQDGLATISAQDKFTFTTDDSGSSSPTGADNLSSVASTVSLNELLENGLDGNNHEDFFSEDNSRFDDFSDEENAKGKESSKPEVNGFRDNGELTDMMWDEGGTIGSQVCLTGAGESGAGDGRFLPVDTSVAQEVSVQGHVHSLGWVNEYSSSESESDSKVQSHLSLTAQTDSFDAPSNSADAVILKQDQALANNFTDNSVSKTASCQSARLRQKPAVKPKPVLWASADKANRVSKIDASRGENWKSPEQSTGEIGDCLQSPECVHCRFGSNTRGIATGNSPDSVMQTSYSSSSDSEIVGSDKVTSRDDGYSSNSAVSVNICKQQGCEAYSKPNRGAETESTVVCTFRGQENESAVIEKQRSPGSSNNDEYKARSVKDIRASFETAASSYNHGEASHCKAKKEKRTSAKQFMWRHHSDDCYTHRRNNGSILGTWYSDTCLNISPFVHTRCQHQVYCRERVMLRRSCSDGALYCHNLRARHAGSRLPHTKHHMGVVGWTTAESATSKRRVTVAPPGGWDNRQVPKMGRQRGSSRSLGEGAENGYCSWENLKPQRPAAIGSEQLINVAQLRDCERGWNCHQVAGPGIHFLADISESDGNWERPRSVSRRREAEVTGGVKVAERSAAWEGSLEAFEEAYQEAITSPQHPTNRHSYSAMTLHDPQGDLVYTQDDLCSSSQGDVRHQACMTNGVSLESCMLGCTCVRDPLPCVSRQRQNNPHMKFNVINGQSDLGNVSRHAPSADQVDSVVLGSCVGRGGNSRLEAKAEPRTEGVAPVNPVFNGVVNEVGMSRDVRPKCMVTSKHSVGGQRSVSAGCAIVAETPKSHPSLCSTTVHR